MTLEELITALPEHPSSTSHIKYDVEKLNWVNHKWMEKLTPQQLVEAAIPFLKEAYNLDGLSEEKLEQLLTLVHTDLITLKDAIEAVKFYFEKPEIAEEINPEIVKILKNHQDLLDKPEEFLAKVKADARAQNIAPSTLFQTIRLLLIGSKKGPHLVGLLEVLGKEKFLERIK